MVTLMTPNHSLKVQILPLVNKIFVIIQLAIKIYTSFMMSILYLYIPQMWIAIFYYKF